MNDPHENETPGTGSPATNSPEPTESPRRWLTGRLVVILATTGAALGAGVLLGVVPNPLARHDPHGLAAEDRAREPASMVKAVHPRAEKSVGISVEQLATVEPYYQADLRARASGIVKHVFRDIGDRAVKGDVLVEIDTPERLQEVARCEAMVLQREQELRVSQARLKDARAARDVSAATIKQREADVQAATATRDLKRRRFQRFQTLAARGTVVGSVVEEEERDYLASDAAVASARANVDRARADLAESDSRVEAASADIDLKKAQIEVAGKDLKLARAVADFGTVRAPFDGVIVRRAVDPGSFVQNATTGVSDVLISIARVDVVTVSARFPDSVAPSVTTGMPAEVRVVDLPGVTIPATVTRFAPSVQTPDRTMRVEIDLFNGDDAEYKRFVKAVQEQTLDQPRKGVSDTLPIWAFPPGVPNGRRLLPGMTAIVRLSVGKFSDSFVLPKTAVYSQRGTMYMLLIQDGHTKQVPVRVQLNDGRTVRVAIVTEHRGPDGVAREVLEDLTGNEVVVVARQLEVGDGAAVRAGLSDW